MLNGYVTYEELKIITGFSDHFLNYMIRNGLNCHQIKTNRYSRVSHKLKDQLFNLQEVEEWLKLVVY